MPMPATAALPVALLDSAAAANPVVQAAPVPAPRLPDRPVDTVALDRFRSLLAGGQSAAIGRSAPVEPAAIAPGDMGAPTLGSRILGGIERAASVTDAKMQYVESGLRADGDSLQDLMRIQAALLSWTYQTELVTKAVSKGAQDLDQLLKQT